MSTTVLFVCKANVCRSPLAEAIFRRQADPDVFAVASAGTGSYHAGHRAHPRIRATAHRHGLEVLGRARQIRPADFRRYRHLIALDRPVLRALARIGAPRTRTRLLLPGRDVADPYFGTPAAFEALYLVLEVGIAELIDELVQ